MAALAAGSLFASTGWPPAARIVATLEPVGVIWVNAIRMTLVPLIVSLLITGIAADADTRAVGRLGARALALFALLAAASAAFAALAVPPLFELLRLDPEAVAAVRARTAAPPSVDLPPFRGWLTDLVPGNPVKAAADGAMLPLIVFSVALALAVTRLEEEPRRLVVRFFEAFREAMLVLIGWVLALAPIGVFAIVLPLAARMGVAAAGAIGWFILVTAGLITIAGLGLYPFVRIAAGLPMRRFARAAAAAQAVGFGTRSSLAALPAMIEAAEHRLALPGRVTGLVLPLAVSVFKFASPITRVAGTLFIARLYGIELGAGDVAVVAAAIAALSFYSPGIPSGGLLVITPLYLSLGLPLEGIGILIAVDTIPDMFMTAGNVTADLAAAAVVGRGGRLDPARPAGETQGRLAVPA